MLTMSIPVFHLTDQSNDLSFGLLLPPFDGGGDGPKK